MFLEFYNYIEIYIYLKSVLNSFHLECFKLKFQKHHATLRPVYSERKWEGNRESRKISY